MRWQYSMASMRKAKSKLGDRLMMIKYEDFVTAPERITRELCDFCDLNYEASMFDFHTTARIKVPVKAREWQENVTKPINKNQINKWKANLSEADLQIIEKICKDEMKKWEYEIQSSCFKRALVTPSVIKWHIIRMVKTKMDPFHWSVLLKP